MRHFTIDIFPSTQFNNSSFQFLDDSQIFHYEKPNLFISNLPTNERLDLEFSDYLFFTMALCSKYSHQSARNAVIRRPSGSEIHNLVNAPNPRQHLLIKHFSFLARNTSPPTKSKLSCCIIYEQLSKTLNCTPEVYSAQTFCSVYEDSFLFQESAIPINPITINYPNSL